MALTPKQLKVNQKRNCLWIVLAALFSINAFTHDLLAESNFAVVELFTSQGCSSCPPADALLHEISAKAARDKLPIFTLSYHVNYWNRLGWTDPYSGKNATDRQYQYAKVLRSQSVYTPQVIVNGSYDVLGSDRRKLWKTIENVRAQPSPVVVDVKKRTKTPNGKLTLSYKVTGHSKGDTIVFALIEPNKTNFVPSGENAGRTLSHTNVVNSFTSTKIPTNSGGSVELTVKGQKQLIAFVQSPLSLKIKAATKIFL